jgi:hypothetical protein
MDAQIEYLYGDSTPSSLKSDFIAFLRDALDFAVEVLLRDGQIDDASQRVARLSEATEKEIAIAETLIEEVSRALAPAVVGASDSLSFRCAARIRQGVKELVHTEADMARALVATEKARAGQAAEHAQGAGAKACEVLLLRQDLPEAVVATTLRVDGSSGYQAELHGHTPYGLKWVIGLEIPASNVLASPMRIERVVEHLEVEAPEETGWIHKQVRIRPQRLDRLYLSELSIDPAATTTVKLRAAQNGTGPGFDLTFLRDVSRVELVRIREGGIDALDSRHDLEAESAAKLRPLYDTLIALAADLAQHRRSLVSASLDDAPIHQAGLRLLVERLVANIAPTVEQISRRSLAPGELVLKRLLDGNRREEVFVSKAELLKKLDLLPVHLQRVFEPLKLWDDALEPRQSATATSAAPPKAAGNGAEGAVSTGEWPALVLSLEVDQPRS